VAKCRQRQSSSIFLLQLFQFSRRQNIGSGILPRHLNRTRGRCGFTLPQKVWGNGQTTFKLVQPLPLIAHLSFTTPTIVLQTCCVQSTSGPLLNWQLPTVYAMLRYPVVQPRLQAHLTGRILCASRICSRKKRPQYQKRQNLTVKKHFSLVF
jgi:hypothetical protein